MKLNSKRLVGIIAILFTQGVVAQFYVGIQSGIGKLKSNVDVTTSEAKTGGALKAGYIFSLTRNVGVGSGIEFSQYKQDVFLSDPSSTVMNYEVDASGSTFIYNINTTNYVEKQILQAIQIPLFMQYKMNVKKGFDFNFRAGAKYFIPVIYRIKATSDNIIGTAYYPDVNLSIDDLPEYGIGRQNGYAATGQYKTKAIFMSSFELGFTFDIGKKKSLYAAIFFEKGYGTILYQQQKQSYIGYNPNSSLERKVNGLYSSNQNAQITPIAFGLTLGCNFK